MYFVKLDKVSFLEPLSFSAVQKKVRLSSLVISTGGEYWPDPALVPHALPVV
jgi:hypothetical protein